MQINVSVRNTYCFLHKEFNALPEKIQISFVKQLSYQKKVSLKVSETVYLLHKNPIEINRQNPSKYYQFPTGLLPKFWRIAKSHGVSVALKDDRGPKPQTLPVESFLKRLNKVDPDIEEREFQIDAIKRCLRHGRGLIKHATGAGKTIVISGVTYCVNAKTLILCWGKEHVRQLSKDVNAYVGGCVTVYGSGRKDSSGQVVVANVQALEALKKKNAREYANLLKKFKCVIGDEIHHASSITYKGIFYYATNAYWKFGFSGTMYREDGSFLEVFGAVGAILDDKGYTFLQNKGYITKARFFIADPKLPRLGEQSDQWPNCLHCGIIENQRRNEWLAKIAGVYQRKNLQVLVISPFRVEHGITLQRLIPDSRFMFGNSGEYDREKALKDFAAKEFSVLIGSKIYDEVINLPDVRAVILAGGGKAHNSFFQRVGRGIRKAKGKTHVDIFIPWDSHSRILLRHSKKILSYITKEEAWRNNVKILGSIRKTHTSY